MQAARPRTLSRVIDHAAILTDMDRAMQRVEEAIGVTSDDAKGMLRYDHFHGWYWRDPGQRRAVLADYAAILALKLSDSRRTPPKHED